MGRSNCFSPACSHRIDEFPVEADLESLVRAGVGTNRKTPDLPFIASLQLSAVLLYVILRTSILGAVILTGYLGGAIVESCFRSARERQSRVGLIPQPPEFDSAGKYLLRRAPRRPVIATRSSGLP